MNTIREYLQKPLVVGILAFLIGLFIGLVILGWGIWPVKYYDAAPANLHSGYQDWWLRMAIESYQVDKDPLLAKDRYDALGEAGPATLETIKQNSAPIDPNAVMAFEAAVIAAPVTPEATPAAAGGKSSLTTLLGIMCVVTLLLGAALLAFFLLQGRKAPGTGVLTPAQQANEAAKQAEMTDYESLGEEAPMAQFMASYRLGDDLFDDSFSIDSPAGEFLGECGVGISKTIGVGDPKKVTAFEVWLFDKNDIQTVTKVVMSSHAFNDATVRQELEAKGEPVEATPGGQTALETATLRLVAHVVDISYGEGPLPQDSFFESLILELAIWQK
jgi:hypothetical protein